MEVNLDLKKAAPPFEDNEEVCKHLQDAISYHDNRCLYQGFWLIYKYWHDARPYKEKELKLWEANLNLGYFRHVMEQYMMPVQNAVSPENAFKIRIFYDLYLRSLPKKNKGQEQEGRAELQQIKELDPSRISGTRISQRVTHIFQHWFSRLGNQPHFFKQLFYEREMYSTGIAALDPMGYKPRVLERRQFVTEPGATIDVDTWNVCWYMHYKTVSEITERAEQDEDGVIWKQDNIRKAFKEKFDNRIPDYENDEHVPFSQSDKLGRLTKQTAAIPIIETWSRNADNGIDYKWIYSGKSEKLTLMEVKNGYERMSHAIFPNVAEMGVQLMEDQRSGGYNLMNIVPLLNRLESSIADVVKISSLIPVRTNIEYGRSTNELKIPHSGIFNIGNHDFAQVGLDKNVQQLMAYRNSILAYTSSRMYLSGLDALDKMGNDKEGRGGSIAEQRILKDQNIHKERRESAAKQLKPLFARIVHNALKSKGTAEKHTECLLHERLQTLDGVEDDIFNFDDKYVSEETGLPCWIAVEPIRNADSSFNAAETIIARNIEAYKGSLNSAQQKLVTEYQISAWAGAYFMEDLKSLEENFNDRDEAIEAQNEHAIIFASVDEETATFQQWRVKSSDNDLIHLRDAHLPLLDQVRQELDQQVDFEQGQEGDDTKRILQYAHLAFHAREHTDILEQMGEESLLAGELREKVFGHFESAEGRLNRVIADNKSKIARNANQESLNPEDQLKLEIESLKAQTNRDKALAILTSSRETNAANKQMLAAKIFSDREEKSRDRQENQRERVFKRELEQLKQDAKSPQQERNTA